MNFQTVFYNKATGSILHIEPNKYIRSKFEKVRFTPGYTSEEVNFLYFPSTLDIGKDTHHVQFVDHTHPPLIVDAEGMPLYFSDRVQLFVDAKRKFKTIIIELNDGVGDYLIQVSSVIEAMKRYPDIKFFVLVPPAFESIIDMCPDVEVFKGYKAHGLDAKLCGKIKLNGSMVADPRGGHYGKASLYGLFLQLPFAPYITRLIPPADFDAGFEVFDSSIGLRADGHNVVIHCRTKNWEEKSWTVEQALDLSRIIKELYDCQVYFIGSSLDWSGEDPAMINLAGKTTWPETAHLLRMASHRIVIDSAPLHLCRALGLSYTCLWGFSHPWRIMGEAPGPGDIVDHVDDSQTNIKAITAERVFAQAFPEYHQAPAAAPVPSRDFSQHGEQALIEKFFEDHPPLNFTLVDVGAFGLEMSNTFALLQAGWSGLLIEANPARVRIVKKEFAGQKVKILNLAVGISAGKAPLYLHSVAGHDSLDPMWHPGDSTDKTVMVNTKPLALVLQENNIPPDFDFLSIDTEGLDMLILSKLLYESAYRPRLICTECESFADAPALFSQYGYTLLAKTGPDDFGNFLFALS